MRDDLTRAGRRRFLRLVGAGAGVGVGLSAATGAASARTVAWERTYRHENRPSQAGAYLSGGDLDTAQGYVVSATADE